MVERVPERLVPVIKEREAELRRTRSRISDVAAPITVARKAKMHRRNLILLAAALVIVFVIAGLLVGSGAFDTIEPTAFPTAYPTVDMASVPQEVRDTIDVLQNSPDPGQRAIAASKLGAPRYQHAASVEPLIGALQDEAWEVRAAAAKSLGRIGDRRAIDALQPLLRDNNSLVRDAAGEALQVGFGLSCSDANGCE